MLPELHSTSLVENEIKTILSILMQNAGISYFMQRSTEGANNLTRITLAQEVSFLNKAAIKETLHKLPEDSDEIIDAQK